LFYIYVMSIFIPKQNFQKLKMVKIQTIHCFHYFQSLFIVHNELPSPSLLPNKPLAPQCHVSSINYMLVFEELLESSSTEMSCSEGSIYQLTHVEL
jgi:hypothetical protein